MSKNKIWPIIILLASCSDNEPSFEPVAGCDVECVAGVAEQVVQNLPSRIYQRSDEEIEFDGPPEITNSINCDQGDIALAGGCRMPDNVTPRALTLSQPGNDFWACRYQRLDTDVVANFGIIATVVCLDSSDL